MKRSALTGFLVLALLLTGTTLALAGGTQFSEQFSMNPQQDAPAAEEIIRGAQIYDRWYAVLAVEPPAGDMPIWGRQSTNSRSGADTWRCAECHGWDYKGASGAYASGSHLTGFPGLTDLVAGIGAEEIVAHLQGSKDPAHDFSAYLDEAALAQVAAFLKFGLIDDDQYIDDTSLTVIGADIAAGQQNYDSVCAACHGADGRGITFRSEGTDEHLGDVARRDPWRFLHRTRFGVAGTPMPIGAQLGWDAGDGRDILAYAQTLGLAAEPTVQPGSSVDSQSTEPQPLGLWGGILAGLGTFVGGIGIGIGFVFIMLAVGALVVSLARRGRRP